MATKKKPAKRTRKRAKASGRPYGRFSGMTTLNTAITAAGVKVFSQVGPNIGDQGTEGDLCRIITNTSASLTIGLGGTQAIAAGANAYKLGPGKDFVLVGPAGIGWMGDLWAAESTSAATLSQMSF